MTSVFARRTTGALTVGLATLAMAALAACGGGTKTPAAGASAGLDTIEPGVLKVAIQAYAPYTSLKAGEMYGLDADVLNAVAKKLNLKVEPQLTDFNGMLGGVQSRRVDITIGGIAWTKERQAQGLFTDPPYYSPPAMAVHGKETYSTIQDLQGKDLGTVTGYVWVKSIKAIPGATLHAYPDANGVFSDLASGRLAVGFLDPLIIIDAKKKRPSLDFTTQYLTPPSAEEIKAQPAYDYLAPYMTSFYVPKQSPKLEQAVSKEIRAMYDNGEMARLVTKYGGDPAQFLKPAPGMAAARQGLDRPTDWTPPAAS